MHACACTHKVNFIWKVQSILHVCILPLSRPCQWHLAHSMPTQRAEHTHLHTHTYTHTHLHTRIHTHTGTCCLFPFLVMSTKLTVFSSFTGPGLSPPRDVGHATVTHTHVGHATVTHVGHTIVTHTCWKRHCNTHTGHTTATHTLDTPL